MPAKICQNVQSRKGRRIKMWRNLLSLSALNTELLKSSQIHKILLTKKSWFVLLSEMKCGAGSLGSRRTTTVGWIIFWRLWDAHYDDRRRWRGKEGLCKRQRYNETFHVATGWVTMSLGRSGSPYFCYSCQVSCHPDDAVFPRLSHTAAGFFPSTRHMKSWPVGYGLTRN